MTSSTSRRRFLGQGAGLLGALAASGRASLIARGEDGPKAKPSAEDLTARGVAFLKPRQADDGSWSKEKGPGITGIVVTALLRSRIVAKGEPAVTRGLAYLERFVGGDGGFDKGPQSNYATAISLMAFHEANQNGKYDALIKSAQGYLKGLQWDENEGKTREDAYYGGAGYGGSSRPDLSNTAFLTDALRDTGLPADDPSLQKALVFVSRCQNLKSEFNDQPWADKVNDGGFIYTAAKGGSSVAGPDPETGGLRSYASMTYAGLKSMIHAGLSADDPRVKAAYEYVKKHYTLDENPGLGQVGLYYYYQTFAKALALIGKPTLVDSSGKSHDWRAEVTDALAKRQGREGEWVNKADRFMEGDPNLVTSYALLALAYSRPKAGV